MWNFSIRNSNKDRLFYQIFWTVKQKTVLFFSKFLVEC
jgi:hypothetical protein